MIGISVLSFAFLLVGQGQASEKTTLAERLAGIQKQYADAESAFQRAAVLLPETQEGVKKFEELTRALKQKQAERFLAAVELAKVAPKSDAGFAALEWVVSNAYGEPAGKFALALMTEHHAGNPQVARLVALAVLKKEHADAPAEFEKSLEALPDSAEGKKKAEELQKLYGMGRTRRLLAAVNLAKADPKSSVGFSALEWVLMSGPTWRETTGQIAVQLLIEHHAANPQVGKIVAYIGYRERGGDDAVDSKLGAFFDAVIQKNKDRTARGQATLAKTWKVMWKYSSAEHKRHADADRLATVAERAWEKLRAEHADTVWLVGSTRRTLGDIAKQSLFEIRHLRVGKTAPDLEGIDLDGKKLQLRDYRGKVTVVVFWATWCGSCMANIPHERKLADRHKDRPFAFVGVNGDSDRSVAKQAGTKAGITWRSFWNGPHDSLDSISETWNVHGWPAVYVLDPKGVIRYRNVFGANLDKAVDELLGKR